VNTARKRDRYWDQKRSDRRPEKPVSCHSRGASSEESLPLAMHYSVDQIQETDVGTKCVMYGVESKSAYRVLVETSVGGDFTVPKFALS
jgi:hypothetical protein